MILLGNSFAVQKELILKDLRDDPNEKLSKNVLIKLVPQSLNAFKLIEYQGYNIVEI